MSVCKFCGREIEWLRQGRARAYPVDPEPVFVIEGDGCERFLTEEEGDVVGREAWPGEIQTREQKENTPLGFVPHWKTCKRRREYDKF